jgi:hypothetical protein
MGFEERLETRPEFPVPFEEVDDRRRIDQNKRVLRQISEF